MEKEERFIKREIPTGTGRESEPKETLPAVEVDNEVIWINPDFPELPLDLREGEQSKLGVFLTPQTGEEKPVHLKMIEGHYRSGLVGRAIFGDKQGRIYRDIDLKGIGHMEIFGRVGEVYRSGKKKTTFGIFNLDYAQYAKDMSEEFLKSGIRTERYLAIVKLNEMLDEEGKKISIKEAQKRKLLFKKQEPAVAIRTLGTKFRIGDVTRKEKEKLERLNDAKKMVAQELSIKEDDFSWDDYLKWFAENSGRNLGLMHKNGWRHNYLSTHNITLDCRIIDLDSVTKPSLLKKKKGRETMKEDCKNLLNSVTAFSYCLPIEHQIESENYKEFLDEQMVYEKKIYQPFLQEYIKNLGYKPEFLENVQTS